MQDLLAQSFTDSLGFEYIDPPSQGLLKLSRKPIGETGCGRPTRLHEQIYIVSLPAFPMGRKAKYTNPGNSMLGSDAQDLFTFLPKQVIDLHGQHKTLDPGAEDTAEYLKFTES